MVGQVLYIEISRTNPVLRKEWRRGEKEGK
jgi:hypothetical protein